MIGRNQLYTYINLDYFINFHILINYLKYYKLYICILKKLDSYFIGPFKVLKASKYNTLVLETLDTKQQLERNIHIKDVKPYYSNL